MSNKPTKDTKNLIVELLSKDKRKQYNKVEVGEAIQLNKISTQYALIELTNKGVIFSSTKKKGGGNFKWYSKEPFVEPVALSKQTTNDLWNTVLFK